MEIFTEYESNVRAYCRSFPAVFNKAKGSILYSEDGKKYIDFFAGAGALNYGHNDDYIKNILIDYINSDNVIHALDMYTTAKRSFMHSLINDIIKPRHMNYKIQFCNPTGTNAVEASLKLARKVQKKPGIFAFMGGFHGMTLGSLSATGNKMSRQGAGIPLNNVTFMPYPHGFMKSFNTIEFIENVLTDANSGIEKPAAIIFETVQAEGGVIVSSKEWLKDLRNLCDKHDILMICDDIQIGCGRTGTFFSFERAGILPDIIILSKSISGYGLPLSLLLIKPELDKWLPGEHSGTFRGNQLAFVAGKAAIDKFWKNKTIEDEILQKERYVNEFLKKKILPIDKRLTVRGIGLIWGIDVTDFKDNDLSNKIIRRCFESGLIIEKVGRDDQVIKIMPPLTIEHELLERGCEILGKVFEEYCFKK